MTWIRTAAAGHTGQHLAAPPAAAGQGSTWHGLRDAGGRAAGQQGSTTSGIAWHSTGSAAAAQGRAC